MQSLSIVMVTPAAIDDGVPMLNPYLHCRDCAPADLPRTPKIRDVPKDQGDVGEIPRLVVAATAYLPPLALALAQEQE